MHEIRGLRFKKLSNCCSVLMEEFCFGRKKTHKWTEWGAIVCDSVSHT